MASPFPGSRQARLGTRVFLDTNVLFASIYSRTGPPARLLSAATAGQFTPVISGLVLDELVRNLKRKAPQALPRLAALLLTTPFEVVAAPPDPEIIRWRDAGSRRHADRV